MKPQTPRVLIFIVAYNAERTIEKVLLRIPKELEKYDTDVLVIDDASGDTTFERAHAMERAAKLAFPLTVLFNPVNLGYGGNQKVGFHYAIRHQYDIVALVHGDGQYAPERLPDLIEPLVAEEADAVFGSRMMNGRSALHGGMPFYKYIGNRILTGAQNWLLGSRLSEFHSGYRLYSVKALSKIPFDLNSNEFHFDTEIIIQLMRAGMRIKELPIPTYYGDEICHVNGMKYARDVIAATLVSRAQDVGLLYEKKFDVRSESPYQSKLGYDSSHTFAIERVPPGSQVLDVGCSSGFLLDALEAKGCRVTGIDQYPLRDPRLTKFIQHDLNRPDFPVDAGEFDYILLLDVIEHLQEPERFVDLLRRSRSETRPTRVIVSTGNVAFLVTRLMLLAGSFNYGSRGILDKTHSRLFTAKTIRKLLQQAGYRVEEICGVPAPFPLALGNNRVSRFAIALNRLLIRVSLQLFAYQVLVVATPLPSQEWLLNQAVETTRERSRMVNSR